MAKRDRDDKKTVATKTLKASFDRVFNAFTGVNAIQVIAEQMQEALKGIATKKYEDMTVEELYSEKQSLQSELNDIDSEIFKRLNPSKTKKEKKEKIEQTETKEEEVKQTETKETNKAEAEKEETKEEEAKQTDKVEEEKK